jgi:3-methylcrotonyl-CoA carboxylase alpha subunit
MTIHNFNKILVANRGEIAVRIIRAIHSLDKRAVVVHSEYDSALLFVTEADEAYSLGTGDLADTYLNQEKIIQIAREAQVDAIHPGYGFLAENAGFAEACRNERFHFIGPSPEAIRLMGDKSSAREKARDLGLPVLEGFVDELEKLVESRHEFPYPLLIKPSAGGGGKGMRIVHRASEFEQAARESSREAMNYFGSGALYVEKYLVDPRHIEVQVLADHRGNSVHLFERECSIQRRYQKIIEEAPSLSVSEKTRRLITDSALKLVNGIGYTNAGTVEFLMEADQSYYFLEMNTRIQVEHPVTEMITGIDLVREQISIAEGHPLSFSQQDLKIHGHSMEARIYAEDPLKDFLPSAGRLEIFRHTGNMDTRIDTSLTGGNLVEPYYDPMIAKVIVAGATRDQARNNLIRSLKEIHVTGLKTNRDFLITLLRSEPFSENRVHTRFVDQEMNELLCKHQESRDSQPHDLFLSAATLIALQSGSPEKRDPASPWHSIGHWRIVPEIMLQEKERIFPVRYELLKGRKRMKLRVEEREHVVCLEEKTGDHYRISIDRHVLHVWGTTDRSEVILDVDGHLFMFRRPDILDERYMGPGKKSKGRDSAKIMAPLNGRVVQINVREGEKVNKGEPLLVIESMKMENKIMAPRTAVIKKTHVSVGEQVHNHQLLFTLDSYDKSSD